MRGSIPLLSTNVDGPVRGMGMQKALITQLVECDTDIVVAGGSSPSKSTLLIVVV